MTPRRHRLVGLVALATVVAAGCTSTNTSGAPAASGSGANTPATGTTGRASYASAPCPNPVLPGVPAANLGTEFTCGYLTVPENRSKPDRPTIRLAVARLKAASVKPQADPVVFLSGGPGSSAIAQATTIAGLGINADRDVIFVEQRGNYWSEPRLVCPEVDAFAATAVTKNLSDPATRQQSKAATTACRDRLASTGVDLASYNSAENARDIADLRVAMGIGEWNLYGVSYGTDLALTVLRDHPAGIRSVVLDSVAPPNVNIFTEFWPAAAAGYRSMFDACAAQPACATAYPNLADEFATTVNRLTTTPVTVPVKDPVTGETVQVHINGYELANLVVNMTGLHTKIPEIPGIIHELANGDGTKAATWIHAFVPPPGISGSGLTFGVFCREFVAQSSPEQVLARAKQALPKFPDAVFELTPQVPWFFDICGVWNVGTAPPTARAPVVSDVPVLMLVGTFDAITAVAFTDAVAPGLKRSQTVPIPGAGHQTITSGPCPVSVMNAFLAKPTDPVERTCVDNLAPPTFTTR